MQEQWGRETAMFAYLRSQNYARRITLEVLRFAELALNYVAFSVGARTLAIAAWLLACLLLLGVHLLAQGMEGILQLVLKALDVIRVIAFYRLAHSVDLFLDGLPIVCWHL